MEKYYPTWVLEESDPLAQAAVATFRGLWDKEPVVDKWTFSTNGVASMGLMGVPTIGFGPGEEEVAHSRDRARADSPPGGGGAVLRGVPAGLHGNGESTAMAELVPIPLPLLLRRAFLEYHREAQDLRPARRQVFPRPPGAGPLGGIPRPSRGARRSGPPPGRTANWRRTSRSPGWAARASSS